MKKIDIHAEREQFGRGVSLSMIVKDGPIEGKTFAVQKLELKEIHEDEYVAPFMQLRTTEAQELMDELWHCGLRPSEGTGSAGSLAATERHLQDMKTIAFRLLEKANIK